MLGHHVKRLNNDVSMPVIGLGTYRSGIGRQTREAVLAALDVGYRSIDTASIYGNEKDVGAAIRESGLDREEVFITTKLWNQDQGFEETRRAFRRSLNELGTDHVDLYLMHWPRKETMITSWKSMEEIYIEGGARAIGVSNFTESDMIKLLDSAEIVPAVNQVEFSPFLYQKDLQSFLERFDISIVGYSPLTKGQRLDDRIIGEISEDTGKTSAQVMIRWAIQHGIITIPKSTKPSRIRENYDVFSFELTPRQMKRLDSLDEGLRTGWDPTAG